MVVNVGREVGKGVCRGEGGLYICILSGGAQRQGSQKVKRLLESPIFDFLPHLTITDFYSCTNRLSIFLEECHYGYSPTPSQKPLPIHQICTPWSNHPPIANKAEEPTKQNNVLNLHNGSHSLETEFDRK